MTATTHTSTSPLTSPPTSVSELLTMALDADGTSLLETLRMAHRMETIRQDALCGGHHDGAEATVPFLIPLLERAWSLRPS